MSVNKVLLIGNLGRDPEIRTFQNSGDRVANLRIATTETYKDRQTGERKEETEWHSVAVYGEGLIAFIERAVRKGSKVYIEGKLKTRKWQDNAGQDRYSTEIVVRGPAHKLDLLSGKAGDATGPDGEGDAPAAPARQSRAASKPAGAAQQAWQAGPEDEDIPF